MTWLKHLKSSVKKPQGDSDNMEHTEMIKVRAKEIRTAIKQDDVERVVKLIGSDPELLHLVMEPFGTWLHVAATYGKLEIVKKLIDLGIDINRCGGVYGGGALNEAASEGHPDVVNYLLSCGAEMDISNPVKNPLFGAIQGGHVDVVKILIANGIDIRVKYSGESMKNMDSVAFAHEQGQKEIANLLDSFIKDENKDTMQNETSEILDYITEHFGPIHNTISEIIPGSKVAVNIQIILPTKQHNFTTLVTTGMSDIAMDETEENVGTKFAELIMKLPANWPVGKEDMMNNDYFWPIKWLRMIAHIPHSYDGWLDEGVILPNGEPPRPFSSNTELSCILLKKSEDIGSFTYSTKKSVDFFNLIPIFEEERSVALQKGHELLLEEFDKHGISEVLDLNRKNIGLKHY